MNNTSLNRIAVTLTSLIACPISNAELELFYTRSAFEAAATHPVFTEDFEDFYSDVLLDRKTLSLFGGAIEVSSKSTRNTAIRVDTPPTQFGSYGIDRSDFGRNFIHSEINVSGTGLLKIDLPQLDAPANRIGFDYSGAGGASPNGLPFFISYQVTMQDGTVVTAVLPDHDGDGWSEDDGFIGFHNPDSPILSVELLTFSDPIYPPGHERYYNGQIYAIDHIITSLPDQDSDGMPDHYEDSHGLDKTSPDADSDSDGDGLSALVEFRLHTDPQIADTDRDGISDGTEFSDPTDRNEPVAFDLRVDFGNIAPAIEAYQSYEATDQFAGDFMSRDYPAFGTEITLTPEFPDTTTETAPRMISRANPDGVWSTRLNDATIARDFLGVDTQTTNGGNGDYDGETGTPTRLALRLGGLPPGTYAWTSFHHDVDYVHTGFIAEISTDGGATFRELSRKRMTSGRSSDPDPVANQETAHYGPALELLPSTVDTQFNADGTHDVVVRFTPLSATDPDTRIFGINAFQLIQTAPFVPPLTITDLTIDPILGEISLTWASVPGRFYSIDMSEDLEHWQTYKGNIKASETGNHTILTFPLSEFFSPKIFFRVSE